MVEQVNGQPQRTQRQVSEADRARAELSDYFRFEDMGVPSVAPEPRGGTSSPEQRPPLWPPQCDAVLMALVYRRLSAALEAFRAETGLHIFTVLRARYGPTSTGRKDAIAADAATARGPRLIIDRAERAYLDACPLFERESRAVRERRRLVVLEERIFGAPLSRWVGDAED